MVYISIPCVCACVEVLKVYIYSTYKGMSAKDPCQADSKVSDMIGANRQIIAFRDWCC